MANFSELIHSKKPTLVDFYATWCGPCKTLAPILDTVKSRMGEGLKILKVDVDRNQKAAIKYGIRSVPTLILFKNGKIIWRQSGVVEAPRLQQEISKYL